MFQKKDEERIRDITSRGVVLRERWGSAWGSAWGKLVNHIILRGNVSKER